MIWKKLDRQYSKASIVCIRLQIERGDSLCFDGEIAVDCEGE